MRNFLGDVFVYGAAVMLIAGPILGLLMLIFDREAYYQPKRKTDRAVAAGFALNLWLALLGFWILGVL
jgi:uncharacterized membrane protein